MTKTLTGCCIALTLALAVAARGGDVALVNKGEPKATIVVADEPLPIPITISVKRKRQALTVAYAAEELQQFIEKATGVKLPIVAASNAPPQGTLVLVGRSALSEQFGVKPPTVQEGLKIATFKRGLAILGEIKPKGALNVDHEIDRGTLFGVYEFLERIVGYRFAIDLKGDPDFGIVTPRHKRLAVPKDYALELAPDFPLRSGGYGSWSSPAALMRVTRSGAGNGFELACHTDAVMRRYYKDHPDWFALKEDGTRDKFYICYNEPGVIEERLRVAETWYTEGGKHEWYGQHSQPTPSHFYLVPADVFSWKGRCYCDKCKAEYQAERGRFGRWSNIVFSHCVDFAEKFGKRWPDKQVGVLAYEGYMLLPEMDLPDNIDVQLCMMWSVTMGKDHDYWHKRNLDLMRKWSEKVGGRRDRLYVWDYYCWPAAWTAAPLFFPHYLQTWFQDTYEFQSGEFINMGGNPPQYELLMAWLWHRLMWDRNADVDALVHDHCVQFFGPAAKPMEAFYRLIFDRYENVPWSREFNESYIPTENLYGETYTAEAMKELKKIRRRILRSAPRAEDDITRRRILWMMEGFDPFFEEADLAHKWLGTKLSYAAETMQKAPADDKAWGKVKAVELVEGNYGRSADRATSVRMARAGDDLLVRFEAAETNALVKGDKLTVWIERPAPDAPEGEAQWESGDAKPTATLWSADVNGEGELGGGTDDAQATLVESRKEDGAWIVTLSVPIDKVLGKEREAANIQFERMRQSRGRGRPRRRYFWTAPMRPPWLGHFRFGEVGM